MQYVSGREHMEVVKKVRPLIARSPFYYKLAEIVTSIKRYKQMVEGEKPKRELKL
jgi:hypothetical protein